MNEKAPDAVPFVSILLCERCGHTHPHGEGPLCKKCRAIEEGRPVPAAPQLEFDPDRVASNGLTMEQNLAEFRELYDAARFGKPIPGEPTMMQMDVYGRLLVTCPSCRAKGILSSPEPRSAWLTPPTFDFGTALRLMKCGKKVRRTKWPSDLWLEFGGEVATIWETTRDSQQLWTPYEWKIFHDDLLAEDWEVVS